MNEKERDYAMKKFNLTGGVLALFILASANHAAAETYIIDKAHTTIGFSVRHMVISNVKGQFNEFSGQFKFDPVKVELSSAELKIDTASIDTNDKKRDDHLRTPDFFDAKKYPSITFKLKSFERNDNGMLNVLGEITMRGVTKPVELVGKFLGAVKDPWGNERVGFTARGDVNRRMFGISYNKLLEAGGMVVGERVNLIIEVEGIKKK